MHIEFPEILPISEKVELIQSHLATSQVVIVAGETGSGKSTQLPKICLQAGYGEKGLIGHTQPRRLAARSVAERVAEELQVEVGQEVGYQMRFNDRVSDQTQVKLMTDGILLNEILNDKLLKKYSVIIIDEAHERSLNIDFLMGFLKRLLPKRPDLRVIITSATLDHERFAEYFHGAPLVEVSGRTYPVELRYQDIDDVVESDTDPYSLCNSIFTAIKTLPGQGDILTFLSTENEIREIEKRLKKHALLHTEILPLFGRLSQKEQQRIFKPHKGRRIILSTNVAETSVTVPGIRYVIDAGMVRISRYSYRNKVQRLPIEPISQASAKQRAGRCGRVAPGICIRLYSEEDFNSRPDHTEPEILRTNLAAVILKMVALRLGKVTEFPFINPPDKRFINDGYRLLQELNAIDKNYRLTPIGRQMSVLPIDPRLARILISASHKHCLKEALVIVSGLSVPDPRLRPHDFQEASDQAHQEYWHKDSDFLSLYQLWQKYHEETNDLSQRKTRDYCQERFLSYLHMREWHEVYQQLLQMMKPFKWQMNEKPATYAALHQSIASGFLSHIGQVTEDQNYQGARQNRFFVFPGSALFKKQPKWLVAAEIVETKRLYARCVAKILPEWLEPISKHVAKKSYFEPYFDQKRVQVTAFEKVSLYGLEIITKRRVHYGPINPGLSREIFIQSALVEGEWQVDVSFFRENQKQIARIQTLENKLRRQDILADNRYQYEHYDGLIPKDCFNGITFLNWVKELSKDAHNQLVFKLEDLVNYEPDALNEDLYPDTLVVKGIPLQVDYIFDIYEDNDGVNIQVPLAALPQMPDSLVDWLIPGWLPEKVTSLIRGLPKVTRKHLVPAPDMAERCCAQLETNYQKDFFQFVAATLNELSSAEVDVEDLKDVELVPHLISSICVMDAQGNLLAQGRDLALLKAQFEGEVPETLCHAADSLTQTGLTDWTVEDLPKTVEIKENDVELTGYPCLIDQGEGADLTVAYTQEQAMAEHGRGVMRLLICQCGSEIKTIRKQLPYLKESGLNMAYALNQVDLIEDIVQTSMKIVFAEQAAKVRSQAEFEALLETKNQLFPTAVEIATELNTISKNYRQVSKLVHSRQISPARFKALQDMQTQLDHLVYPNFIQQTPQFWFKRLVPYLKGMLYRLEKLDQDINKDEQKLKLVQYYWDVYLGWSKEKRVSHIEFRWLIEEFRISMFAQHIKTAKKVSEKILDAFLAV